MHYFCPSLSFPRAKRGPLVAAFPAGHKVIVWPAHRGAVGYSSVKVASDGTVAVHFDSGIHADGCYILMGLTKYCGKYFAPENGTILPGKAEECTACGLQHQTALKTPQLAPVPGKGAERRTRAQLQPLTACRMSLSWHRRV